MNAVTLSPPMVNSGFTAVFFCAHIHKTYPLHHTLITSFPPQGKLHVEWLSGIMRIILCACIDI